jgi:hypothetical protein
MLNNINIDINNIKFTEGFVEVTAEIRSWSRQRMFYNAGVINGSNIERT